MSEKKFPRDDDGEVLRGLSAKGVDLSKPRLIEFYCYVANKAVGNRVSAKMTKMGLKCDLHEYAESSDPEKRFSVYGGCKMVPSYDAIVEVQRNLNLMLGAFGTRCDGWATLVDPSELKKESTTGKISAKRRKKV